MRSTNTLRRFCSALLVVGLLLVGSTAFAATISGTITNSTPKSGRVYVGLRDSGGNRNIGVSVTTAASGTAPYTISGVPDGQSYWLEAYLDTVGAGMQHANDPSYKSLNTLTPSGDLPGQNFTLTQPSAVTFSDADPSRNQFFGHIDPATDGAAAMIFIEEIPFANNSINPNVLFPIPEKLKVTCTGAGVDTATVEMPVNDNMMLMYKGLTGGAMSCTVVPVVNGVDDTVNQLTLNQTIGVWDPATSNNGNPLYGRPAGASVTGNFSITGLTPGASTPLYIALEDVDTEFVIVGVVPDPSVMPHTFTIPNVPTGTYRVYGFLDVNNNHRLDAGDPRPLEHQVLRVVVDSVNTSYHAGTITLDTANRADARVSVSVGYEMSNPNNPGGWYNLNFAVGNGTCNVAHVSIDNHATPASNQLNPAPLTLIPSDWGEVEYWVNVQKRPSDSGTAPDKYMATITYTSTACGTNGVETIPLQIIAIPEAPARPTFPWGNVYFSGTEQASWQTPSPFPWHYYEYSGEDGPDMNISTLVTPLVNVPANWWNGPNGYLAWNLKLDDLFGNQTQVVVPYTVMGSGPVINSISPTSGPAGTPVTITGSGYVDPIVTFNGVLAAVSSSSATSISTTVPVGAGAGPITVTSGGPFGVGTTTASIDSFTPTINWGATYSSGTSYSRIAKPGVTCNDSTFTGCVSGVDAHVLGTTHSATTDSYGKYTIPGIPAGVPLELMLTKTGYRDSYSAYATANSDVTVGAFSMIDDAMLTTWNFDVPDYPTAGVTTKAMAGILDRTKGLIRSSVKRNYEENIPGAVVHAYSWRNGGIEYKVVYGDSPGADNTQPPNPALTETGNSGRFYVLDVDDGDFVTVIAEKNGYAFRDRVFHVRAGAISQSGANYGDVEPTVFLTTPGQTGPNYTDPLTVTLTPSAATTIYYTTSGADPRLFGTACSSTATTNPCSFVLNQGSYTVRYTVKLGAPVNVFGNDNLNYMTVGAPDNTPPNVWPEPPGDGNWDHFTTQSPVTVQFRSNEPADIYYTTNGTDPLDPANSSAHLTVSISNGLSDPLNITDMNVPCTYNGYGPLCAELKYYACDKAPTPNCTGGSSTARYYIDAVPPETTLDSTPGQYIKNDVASTFYFSGTDGQTLIQSYQCSLDGAAFATCASPVTYAAGALSLGSHTFQVLAVDYVGNVDLSPASYTWTIDATPPTTTATPSATLPASGYYIPGTTVNVTLSAGETTTIYYTLDGTTPTIGSSVYGSAIAVSATTTIKYFSVDSAGNAEAVKSATYSFGRVKVTDATGAYNLINSALAGVSATGKTITAKDDTFVEAVVVNKPSMIVTLSGGYDSTLAGTPTGRTVIDGTLKIQSGTLRVKRLAIK